ncbi:3-oxoacyl-[acyl-carrier-protein] synthase III C-terminal domain-containing protein [Nocardia vulneris]|uniref:3-oxoacyl-ACP synthase n=1 Tax=Nocardia vulneris TaxID=1141657 RepID=A0ABR4ZA95_9NOCA|nr:3-oxoacyl-[acyl-carrier-protein] synthase III C-terminal domain-containing protein [Nocardia vulneris]KIA62173.1 hypothetical protein FG87_26645 [Nocardia vulneris]
MDAYITATATYLPGDAVANDEMESRLGLVAGKESAFRETILKHNGIRSRHYAISRAGHQDHLNDELAARAVDALLRARGLPLSEIGLLAAGTTLPDLVAPGFASMVHGRLAEYGHAAPLEILTAGGVCTSGAAVLRHAVNAVCLGAHDRAIVCASELMSQIMRGRRFERESIRTATQSEAPKDYEYFNSEFLRWMLSDGAGAVLVENQPAPDRPSLRVDWVAMTSYAHMLPTCMYIGADNAEAPTPGHTVWSAATVDDAEAAGMLMLRQDTRLLGKHVVEIIGQELERLIKVGKVDTARSYDWYLPHISSYFFWPKVADRIRETELVLPDERWFTNLDRVGNVGSASFYLMLDEAVRTGLIQPGHRVLAMIPESGRFCVAHVQLTCVPPTLPSNEAP